MKYFLIVTIITITFAGCVGNTGIVKISDDTYMLGRQSVTSNSGSVVKTELYQEANDYCAKMGKKFIQVSNSHTDYKQFQTFAGAEIQFKCQ